MQGYFHLGNTNYYDRYTAERMLSELQALAIPGKELYGIMLRKYRLLKIGLLVILQNVRKKWQK